VLCPTPMTATFAFAIYSSLYGYGRFFKSDCGK
jgi:hypothetical protein